MDDQELKVPPLEELQAELARENAKYEFRRTLLQIAGILAVTAAVVVLVTTRLAALLQVSGVSMAPTLEDGEIVILYQTRDVGKGDIIGFYYGGKVLLKRVIGSGGDYIDIDEEGNVYVNGSMLDEPYLDEKRVGKCDLDLPYQVPEGMVFVLGDNREVSIDSRTRSIGCVESNQIAGIAVCRVWPLARMEMMQ